MHIAFLNPQGNFDSNDNYWAEHPDFGGQLVYVKEIAQELSRLGHQVDILTRKIIDPGWPEFSEDFDSYSNCKNLRIIRVKCGPPGFLRKEELWPYLVKEWVPNIVAFYKNENGFPDFFTAHYGDGGLAGAALFERSGTPFTFTAHSLGAQKMEKVGVNRQNFTSFDSQYHFSSRIEAERISMKYASKIITSTHQESKIQYMHPAYHGAIDANDGNQFLVIPPGVNQRVFSQQATNLDLIIQTRFKKFCEKTLSADRCQRPFIMSAGRLDPKKNLLGLIKAYAANDALQEKTNLLIAVRSPIGNFDQGIFLNDPNNSYILGIKSAIERFNLTDKVLIIPLNNQNELAAGYRIVAKMGSVFILPALYEPFGLAPLEAMACGLPAVVTKNGGPAESMFENSREFGVLIDPESKTEISFGLLRLINSNKVWKEFQKAGISRVNEKYTWEKTAAAYEKLFKEVVRNPEKKFQKEEIALPEFSSSKISKNPEASALFDWLDE